MDWYGVRAEGNHETLRTGMLAENILTGAKLRCSSCATRFSVNEPHNSSWGWSYDLSRQSNHAIRNCSLLAAVSRWPQQTELESSGKPHASLVSINCMPLLFGNWLGLQMGPVPTARRALRLRRREIARYQRVGG
jgi:hypothetical protein